ADRRAVSRRPVVVHCDLLAGLDVAQRLEYLRETSAVEEPRIGPVTVVVEGAVAQCDRDLAAAPGEDIVGQHGRPVWAEDLLYRHQDDRHALDHGALRDRLAREDAPPFLQRAPYHDQVAMGVRHDWALSPDGFQ